MKIYLDMIGCRLNQSEIEIMARQFTAAGHSLQQIPGKPSGVCPVREWKGLSPLAAGAICIQTRPGIYLA